MTRLRKFGDVSRFDLQAADGELGKLHDLYFDCGNWLIRYISVSEGMAHSHKVHLIPSVALDGTDEQAKELFVELTREEVLRGPLIDARLNIHRNAEREVYDYYGWPVYWEHEHGLQLNSAHSPYPYVPPAAYHQGQALAGDHTLCSLSELGHYRLRADGSTVGQVNDVIIDTRRWSIAYLEVEAKQAQNAMLKPRDVKYVDWTDKQIVTHMNAFSG